MKTAVIDEAFKALKKGLEGLEKLAIPVMKVAKILAKVWNEKKLRNPIEPIS